MVRLSSQSVASATVWPTGSFEIPNFRGLDVLHKKKNDYVSATRHGTCIFNRQASQVIMVRPCLPSDTLPKIILHVTIDGIVVAEEGSGNHGETTSRNDKPIIRVIAAYYRRQKSMGDHHVGGVCHSKPQRRLDVAEVC